MKVAAAVALLAGLVPLARALVLPRADPTPVSAATIASFKPYSFFASAGYCKPNVTISWTCGANCNALQGFLPTASGGDGSDVQFWFVGFYPPLNSVLVVHQGTDPSQIQALLNDADFILDPLNQKLFPGAPSGIKVHSGFREIHEATAPNILAAVRTSMAAHGTNKVAVAGHSLGAALAMLDAVYLRLNLPASTSIKFVGYGTPRVGNPTWASFVDAQIPDLTHINNKKDIVPILPGRFLGYAHPHGEIHIQDSNAWVSCALPDDTAPGCIIDEVPNIFVGEESDHDGPYDGVLMGC
ncbi:lipase class 3 family protein [Exidia glandulosa HHB12029]|uniref:Lipase class 3 family protein n=1 Tax=Exidia glandulosa HHB12029 TaxID=1314781 RepID=A0A165PHK9_EXIGL|nr:lipase class 3 family protein [Exidia glandulosa HHB12029]